MVNIIIDEQESVMRFVELNNAYKCVLRIVLIQIQLQLLAYALSIYGGRYPFTALIKSTMSRL